MAGCGGAPASVVGVPGSSSLPITKARAIAYAHAVNLRAGGLQGFTSSGSETYAPEPGPFGLEYARCRGGVYPARPIAKTRSPEFSAGRGFYGEIIRSVVEVWPTPSLVVANQGASHSVRGRACLERYLKEAARRINRERKGRMAIGPFTITTVAMALPGVSHGFLTAIDETRLLRSRVIRAHIYRDIYGFISGAAEIELEAVGFGHRIPASTEKRALAVLLARARAKAI